MQDIRRSPLHMLQYTMVPRLFCLHFGLRQSQQTPTRGSVEWRFARVCANAPLRLRCWNLTMLPITGRRCPAVRLGLWKFACSTSSHWSTTATRGEQNKAVLSLNYRVKGFEKHPTIIICIMYRYRFIQTCNISVYKVNTASYDRRYSRSYESFESFESYHQLNIYTALMLYYLL